MASGTPKKKASTRKTPVASAPPAGPVLVLALPRGRIKDEAVELFGKAGIDLSVVNDAKASRLLIIEVPKANMRVLIVRDHDVPVYVEHGAAHIGIAGRDVLEEQNRDIYEPLDLGIGRCRLAVAEAIDKPVIEGDHLHLRYATKFPGLTKRFLRERGIVAEVITLYGSIELAPLVGLADRIVDLVSTGETLKQNRLVEVETIGEVSARLCVGRAASRLMSTRIDDLIARLSRVIDAGYAASGAQ